MEGIWRSIGHEWHFCVYVRHFGVHMRHFRVLVYKEKKEYVLYRDENEFNN